MISHEVKLTTGEVVEISIRIDSPSKLPENGRMLGKWELVETPTPELIPRAPADGPGAGRPIDALGISTAPTPNWSKILHALDGDTYVIYRAPVSGKYRLTLTPYIEETQLFSGERWRDAGMAPQMARSPSLVDWNRNVFPWLSVSVKKVDTTGEAEAGMFIEAEPNDTPEQAQPIALKVTDDDQVLHIVGGADDIEYFDNGRFGKSGDDWFRLEFNGTEPRLLSACLSIPDQLVVAQVRCYMLDADKATVTPGELLPLTIEYEEGKNPNERVHQQNEQYRIAINRQLHPGKVYFLRVEANAPGYDLELRIVRPAPFDDPHQAVRHALYDHVGQVDSWLMNRPRGGAVERRIRDTGNLLGTMCMSCHTQSGVWGPAIPLSQGYRVQNAQLLRELTNICYQSMRPTNVLIDAANNTSLAPLDLGDGPAGTRVAGHAVVSIERFRKPRKLHSTQAIRAANFVLQSGDPGGINAAGPGANVGQGVVFNYAGEILFEAWQATGDPKYFRALEDKARKMLDIDVKFCDDLGHRVEFFNRYFPQEYPVEAERMAQKETDAPEETNRVPYEGHKTSSEEAIALQQRIQNQLAVDLNRLRDIQQEDGSWGFNPGQSNDDGKTWKVTVPNAADPSPTAMALLAFQASGFGPEDPTVSKGVTALLKMQHPTGYWNAASQTGFVSTSYAMHALSRLYPVDPPTYERGRYHFDDDPPESQSELIDTLRKIRELSMIEEPALLDIAVMASKHSSPLVRFYAMMTLGSLPSDEGIKPLIEGLGDKTKIVRESAQWGLRQTLIDDRGWDAVSTALKSEDDYVRESAAKSLLMRVDTEMPQSTIDMAIVGEWLSQGINDDPHPAVRAWSMRAAWNWWIWNPSIRPAINAAWVTLYRRPEPNVLVENAMRYQSHALFIANGHRANGSGDHQYPELKSLFADLNAEREKTQSTDPDTHRRIVRRVVASAATFYNTAGGDGGPGQMGYVTPGQGELFGSAILAYLKSLGSSDSADATLLQSALEGAANIPHRELQQTLIDYSLNGPEDLRPIAASSVSDPRSAQLVAVPELLEPLLKQIERGAAEPARRPQLSDPVLKLFSRVKWVIPETVEQQREIFTYLVPAMTDYVSVDEIASLEDPAEKAKREREMESAWYLIRGLGDAVGNNPDLRIDSAIERVPDEFQNPLQVRFWLPSVEWILTYKTMLPEVKLEAGQAPPIDPLEELRSRVLLFFIEQLSETAHAENRELAVRQAQATALRRNPEVLNALDALVKFETREEVVKMANNVLSTGRENFLKDLEHAVKQENPPRFAVSAEGKVELPAEFVQDFEYFRDYVSPEMNRVLRSDQRSCFACHGVPGRVPPLTLHNPDDVGYLPVGQILENYRLLQGRIDLKEIEKSKLLRKPLNVQTGKEDGHQGGRRYQPDDPGYQILRSWVLNQGKNHEHLGFSPLSMGDGKD
ncbi:MAG: hypothetical protein O2955_05595 [Planctomycetota bacterium]|nr:hypothetical protein [Planctomycetota bacterium]MDA1211966.1 hypothetical protein [Planctomycetota bacterium]